jgi:hypothetical protein
MLTTGIAMPETYTPSPAEQRRITAAAGVDTGGEIRNPKLETRRKSEIRNSNAEPDTPRSGVGWLLNSEEAKARSGRFSQLFAPSRLRC